MMAKQKKTLRICLAASVGGHLSQLLKLAECWAGYETFCITTSEVMRQKLSQCGKIHVVGECNRQHLLKAVAVLSKCVKSLVIERPKVVISTGAAPACIVCFLGKLMGAKIIWVDSITNVERISLSGRLVRPIADLFLVQWPEIAEEYGNVEYAGTLV